MGRKTPNLQKKRIVRTIQIQNRKNCADNLAVPVPRKTLFPATENHLREDMETEPVENRDGNNKMESHTILIVNDLNL
jgi:hypothetical protein